ncbi:MAG: quinoprotein dehydrogenase-associated SoxYZ-like carrier, partial [Hyphomicrobiaceae bacterium]
VFSMAPDSGIASLSTRVRVNAYSDVRAIAELNDGTLFMIKRFVKASGGCSAPATKNADIARKQMGRMKLRQFAQNKPAPGQSRMHEVQIMIRHPNNSGLQKDQLTGYYIPAHYVDTISVSRSGKSLLGIEGAISLSENPMLRFNFWSRGSEKLEVQATDTEQNVFRGDWVLTPSKKQGS